MTQIKHYEIETMEKLLSISEEYDVFKDESYEEVLNYLPKDKFIIELGCGTGAFTFRICDNALAVIGIDISKSVLKIAKEKKCDKNNVDLICADIEKLPIKNSSVDMVFCGGILHHFKILNGIIKEMARVLIKDGLVFAFEPNGLNPWIKLRYNMNQKRGIISPNEITLDPRYLKKIFKEFGFFDPKIFLINPEMNTSAAIIYTGHVTKLNNVLCLIRRFILFIISLIPLLVRGSFFIFSCKRKI